MMKLDQEAIEALADLGTHRRAWRTSLLASMRRAKYDPPDIDDRSYWEHEIEVFDRVLEILTRLDAHIEEG
jgi:hypothetical protein